MSPSLFRNKKGQTVDVLGGIQRAVSWLLTTAPKPLLYLLFLLFLIVFSALFGFILNSTGNFCDTAGNEYSTGVFSVSTNFQLIRSMPSDDELSSASLDPDDNVISSTLATCVGFYGSGWHYKDDNGTEQNLTIGSYYRSSNKCVSCDLVKVYSDTQTNFERICTGDAYPLSPEEMGWWWRSTCGKQVGFCKPPINYYYESSNQQYVCNDDSCIQEEGEITTQGELWNQKLLEEGAKLKADSVYEERDYRNAVAIECEAGDLTPKMRFFGINIFDYKLWLMLMVLSALVWAVFKIKK